MRHQMDDAVNKRDMTAAVRFAKLYKPLGKEVGAAACNPAHIEPTTHTITHYTHSIHPTTNQRCGSANGDNAFGLHVKVFNSDDACCMVVAQG